MGTISSLAFKMIPHNKYVRQLVWYFWYVDTAVEDSELCCYNTEGDRNSVVSQDSWRIDVTRLEHDEAGGIRRHRRQQTVGALGD